MKQKIIISSDLKIMKIVHSFFLLLFVFYLVGCSSLSKMDGSASMHISVEVYKGPLTKELGIQVSELVGKIGEGQRTFSILKRNVEISMVYLSCSDHLTGFKPGKEEVKNYNICPILQEIWKDARAAEKKFTDLHEKITRGSIAGEYKYLIEMSVRHAEWLRSRAAFWATDHAAIKPPNKRVRIEMVNFIQFASDYGNQIGSRADALIKQIEGVDGNNILREQLSSTVFLRDSASTRYLNLYDWNDASVSDDMSSRDRVRMVEQLIQDTHWEKINSVYASGQGSVRMAFIKDDIGNWNLKNFSNDPGELLKAYKSAGSAALKGATQLLSNINTAGAASTVSTAKKMIDFSNQLSLGVNDNSTEFKNSLNQQRQALVSYLLLLKTDFKLYSKTIKSNLNAKKILLNEQENLFLNAKNSVQSELDKLSSAKIEMALFEKRIKPDNTEALDAYYQELKNITSKLDSIKLTYNKENMNLMTVENKLLELRSEFYTLESANNNLINDARQKLREVLTQYALTITHLTEVSVKNKSVPVVSK